MSKRNRNRRPARRLPFRDAKKRILIVCEGAVTEREYIEKFCAKLRTSLVVVKTVGLGGSPKTVVADAKRRRDDNLREAKAVKDANVLFDEVWCVFDRDDHADWDQALQMGRANSLSLAASNPSVELWLLLHFQTNPGMQHRSKIAQMLKEHLSGYDKHVDFQRCWPAWREAADRAEKLDRVAIEDDEPHRNPTTGFYGLVNSIYAAVSPNR